MKRFLSLSIFTLVAICLSSPCQAQQAPAAGEIARNQDSRPVDGIVKGNSQFAFEFYHLLKNKKGNLFFSPYGVSSVFAMAIVGAKGDTAAEMQRVLHYPLGTFPLVQDLNQLLISSPDARNPTTQLLLANALWIQQGLAIQPAFQLAMKHAFGSSIELADFSHEPFNASKTINQWASRQTKGKIDQLLAPQDISAQTRLVLTNAIYLRAQWIHQFDPKLTTKENFYTKGQRAIQTLMMKTTQTLPLFVNEQISLVEIPYLNKEKGVQLRLAVLLPNEQLSLESLEQELNFERWRQWEEQLADRKVNLSLPRFRIEERLELNSFMKELGMVKAFSPLADFSGITGKKELFISQAVQKTFIRLDEQGTEAAAATGVAMNATSILAPEEPYELVVNRPFLFLIIDQKTQSILFIGRVAQP